MERQKKRCLDAVEKYLERHNFEIVEKSFAGFDFVAVDPTTEDLAFVVVRVVPEHEAGFGTSREFSREKFEAAAIAYLMENQERYGFGVRLDEVSILVMGEDRALIRHHKNALS